jgi:hypothetical protein
MLPRMDGRFRLVPEDEALRRWERLKLDLSGCLILQKPGTVQLVNARFKDVSKDGIAIFAGVELAVDSEVELEFTPPTGHGPLRFRAVVRNRRDYTYGLEFLPRDTKEAQTLSVLKEILLSMGTPMGGSPDDRRWPD